MTYLSDATPLLLTTKKAAERLGVTPSALTATARRSGHLIKMGNRLYVRSTDLEQIIESAKVPSVEKRISPPADTSADHKLTRAMEAAKMLKTKGKLGRR